MLRIGKLTDYALLIMSQIAKEPQAILSATLLAETLHLGTPTVSKILKILSEANLVTSTRGAEGGYSLSRSPNDITVAEIIAAMEGEIAMTECSQNPGLCTIDSLCTLKENWLKINDTIKKFLNQVTLLDMQQPLKLAGDMHDK